MKTAAARRFRVQGLAALAIYFGVFSGTFSYVEHYHPAGALLWALAATTALPLLLTFAVMGRYLAAETDGYKREIAVRCLLWGVAAALGLHLVESFARIFGASVHLPPFTELYVFAFVLLLAKFAYRLGNHVEADA